MHPCWDRELFARLSEPGICGLRHSGEITNYLELLASTFAVKAFTKDKENIQVHL